MGNIGQSVDDRALAELGSFDDLFVAFGANNQNVKVAGKNGHEVTERFPLAPTDIFSKE